MQITFTILYIIITFDLFIIRKEIFWLLFWVQILHQRVLLIATNVSAFSHYVRPYISTSSTQCSMNILVLKAAIKMTVESARFSSFFTKFCYIWWLFRVLHSPFWKIIKYYKKFWENEKNILIIQLPKCPLLEPKIFIVQWTKIQK